MIDFNARLHAYMPGAASYENELKIRSEQVVKDLSESKENYFYLGLHLKDIWDTKCYCCHKSVDDGWNLCPANFFDFCFITFGLEKSQVSRYMNIVSEFGDGARGFKKEYTLYSYSQLSEMLSLTPEERKVIPPDWTIKRIREYKKELASAVATSQQEKEEKIPFTKIFGKLDKSFASAKSKEVISSRDVLKDDELLKACNDVCKGLLVGFDYAPYWEKHMNKSALIVGLLGFAVDVGRSMNLDAFGNSFYAYKALSNLGYIVENNEDNSWKPTGEDK